MLHKSKLFVKRNAPTILTYFGVAGVVVTSVMAVKATPKAVTLLESARDEKGEELTDLEVIVTAAPVYIPSVIVGVSTIACILGANVLNKHQQAALVSAYTLLDSSYKEYKNKVNELLGEDASEQIKLEIAKDKYKEGDYSAGEQLLFYDSFSGRYFESTMFKVQQAEYYLNRDLTMRDYAYLNEFYEHIGIPTIDSGWKLGWSSGACFDIYWQNWIDFNHKKVVMDDGCECIIVTMFQEPIIDFENYC